MASMTDIVFLLLIFFMITSTLVAPNALKLLKCLFAVIVACRLRRVEFREIEPFLQNRYGIGNDDIFISLHAEKSVPWEEVVKIMNIARKNKYKMIAATAPEN